MNDLAPLLMTERITIAGLIGLAVGTEREWSGPADGPQRRFAGMRTFLLFGILGGVAGLMLDLGATFIAGLLIASGLASIVVAYALSVRRPEQRLDSTTEAAALVVLALGALAGLGYLGLSAGVGAVVVFALGEKQRLHWIVRRIGKQEMHAALEFLVLALVILPLLPVGPIESLGGLRPQALWSIVLLMSAIDFASYLARRSVGPGRGYGITGALAGLISSTILTLQFARLSRREPANARGLSLGVLAASTVLPFRIMVVTLVLNPSITVQLLYYLVPAIAVGAASAALIARNSQSEESPAAEPRNPLRVLAALQMTVIFEAAFLAIDFARSVWGNAGIVGSSILFGLADMDALTVSLSQPGSEAALASIAAKGIAIGLITNTVSKLLIAVIAGEKQFRKLTFSGLALTAIVLSAILWWRW